MKYFLISLGCQMNLSDSQRIESVLISLGYEKSENEDEANIIGIIACSVRQKAIDKVYSKIYKINKSKNEKNILTFVSGCILKNDRKKFANLFDFVIDISDITLLPNLIKSYGVVNPLSNINLDLINVRTDIQTQTLPPPIKNHDDILNSIKELQGEQISIKRPQNKNIESFWNVSPKYVSNFIGYIPIQNGCDKFCSFCAVPFTRGKEISRNPQSIIDEFKFMLDKEYKSITLLGQNVNSYGHDIGYSFEELLDKLGEISAPYDVWVYFTAPHPKDFTLDLLHIIKKHKNLANQIHLPLQSGDNKLLAKMNREYNLEKYRQIAKSVRKILPSATLFTDIIVGFSDESEEQFENTKLALKEFEFNMCYVAVYSKRYGSRSYRWADSLSHEEKNSRFHILTDIFKQTSKKYNQTLLDKDLKVLVTNIDKKGFLQGETEGKIVSRILNVKDENLLGKFVTLKVTNVENLSIRGNIKPL